MTTTNPWFGNGDAAGDPPPSPGGNPADASRTAMVAFARSRLIDGRRPELAFVDLVELGTDRRSAAIAVCVAAGTPWAQAEARMASYDPVWASLAGGSAEAAGGLLELYGYFDTEVPLDEAANVTAAHLRQAMAAVDYLPGGYTNQLHRLLRTGQLREAFLSLEEMGGLRWPDNGAFWAAMVAGARHLDDPATLDHEVAAARRRCERRAG